MNWYIQALKRYMVFEGRARRSEFWWFLLVNVLINYLLGFTPYRFSFLWMEDANLLAVIFRLTVLLPTMGVLIRRLQDTGRGGMLAVLALIPIINFLVIFWCIQDSQPGSNEHGPNPKGVEAAPDKDTSPTETA